jgi:hypothetical protein
MDKIRYVWIQSDGKYLYNTLEFKDRVKVKSSPLNEIFVNILERQKKSYHTIYKVRLFYADGTVMEGWTSDNLLPIRLSNVEEMFDGRFNT